MIRSAAVAIVLAGVDAAAIMTLRPAPGRLMHELSAPREWFSQVGTDRALATVAAAGLWCLAVYVGLGLLAVCAARLPGLAGRTGARASRVLLPGVLHRLVVGSAGLGVLLAPVAAGAHPVPGRPVPGGVAVTSVPAPEWPLDGPARARTSTAPAAVHSMPAPRWPSVPPGLAGPTRARSDPTRSDPTRSDPTRSDPTRSDPTRSDPTRSDPTGLDAVRPDTVRPAPTLAAPIPVSAAPPRRAAAGPGHADGQAVTVAPGDSLWLIAARRLGPGATPEEIAEAWPHWYAANRTVLGADPALIVPGQVLDAPAPKPEEASG